MFRVAVIVSAVSQLAFTIISFFRIATFAATRFLDGFALSISLGHFLSRELETFIRVFFVPLFLDYKDL